MKLTEEQISQVADLLDFGMSVFYNLKTGEIKDIMDPNCWIDIDQSLQSVYPDESEVIEANRADYFEFVKLDSYKSFQIMVDFAESVNDNRLRYLLIEALNKSKPYKNFKNIIDHSGSYRQE
jgi:hypothetical protein